MRTPTNNNIADLRATASIVEKVSDNVTYMGFCNVGSQNFESTEAAEAAPIWSILKVTKTGVVNPIVTRMEWAEGLASYCHKWSERAAYSYKFPKF